MNYRRVVKIKVREYDSNGFARCKATTHDSRGHMTGGCDVLGKAADAVRECLTLVERKEAHEVIHV